MDSWGPGDVPGVTQLPSILVGGMLFYKSSTNNSLRGQKVAIGSKNDLSTKKKFISGLPKYPTGPRSTVGLNLKKKSK